MYLNRAIRNTLGLIFLFSFACLFLSGPAYAGEKTFLGTQQFFRLFEKFITADSPFSSDDLEISDFNCRPDTLEIPPGKIEYRFDMGPMTGRLGLRTFYLDVLVNDRLAGKIKMSGNVQLFGNVLSAARPLKRGSVLTRQDLEVSKRNITMLGTDIAKDPALVVGKQLKTSLQPGRLLYTSHLKPPQIIKRGDMVVILADSGRIQVSVQGKARSSGALGDLIKVKNMMSRKEIYAKVINQDEVQVEF